MGGLTNCNDTAGELISVLGLGATSVSCCVHRCIYLAIEYETRPELTVSTQLG